jgi:hypothetical protein
MIDKYEALGGIGIGRDTEKLGENLPSASFYPPQIPRPELESNGKPELWHDLESRFANHYSVFVVYLLTVSAYWQDFKSIKNWKSMEGICHDLTEVVSRQFLGGSE